MTFAVRRSTGTGPARSISFARVKYRPSRASFSSSGSAPRIARGQAAPSKTRFDGADDDVRIDERRAAETAPNEHREVFEQSEVEEAEPAPDGVGHDRRVELGLVRDGWRSSETDPSQTPARARGCRPCRRALSRGGCDGAGAVARADDHDIPGFYALKLRDIISQSH